MNMMNQAVNTSGGNGQIIAPTRRRTHNGHFLFVATNTRTATASRTRDRLQNQIITRAEIEQPFAHPPSASLRLCVKKTFAP